MPLLSPPTEQGKSHTSLALKEAQELNFKHPVIQIVMCHAM